MKESQLRRLIKKQIKESLREERMGPYKPFDIDDEIRTNDSWTWDGCCNLYKQGKSGGWARCCEVVADRDGDNVQSGGSNDQMSMREGIFDNFLDAMKWATDTGWWGGYGGSTRPPDSSTIHPSEKKEIMRAYQSNVKEVQAKIMGGSDPCECCYGNNMMIKGICCRFCNKNVYDIDSYEPQ